METYAAMNILDENSDKQIYHVFCSDWIDLRGTTKLYVVNDAMKWAYQTWKGLLILH